MKSVLLTVIGFVFALCLAVVCGLGFKPAYTVSANTDSSLKMEDGAQVRLVANNPGLRFTASISTEEYEAVKAASGTFGMFILPNAYRTSVGEINEATAFGDSAVYCWDSAVDGKTQIIHCSTDNLTQTSTDGNTTYFACAITNIKVENYEGDFFARAYYEVNGERTWADANETNVRSVSYVAQKVLGYEKAGTYTPSATGKTALLEYVTQFEEVDAESFYVADFTDGSTLTVNDTAYTSADDMFAALTTGRHTVIVTHSDGSTWDIPFVYADYVIRNSEDLLGLVDYYVDNDTNTTTTAVTLSNKYIVVANDVTCAAGDTLTHSVLGTTLFGSTFDGYGHAIKNLTIGNNRRGLLGALDATTVKDFALVNVTVTATNSPSSGLCGNVQANSKLENVFVSGAVTKAGTQRHLFAQEIKGAVENCIVVDTSYNDLKVVLGNAAKKAVLGTMPTANTDATLTNVIVKTHISSSYALNDGSRHDAC